MFLAFFFSVFVLIFFSSFLLVVLTRFWHQNRKSRMEIADKYVSVFCCSIGDGPTVVVWGRLGRMEGGGLYVCKVICVFVKKEEGHRALSRPGFPGRQSLAVRRGAMRLGKFWKSNIMILSSKKGLGRAGQSSRKRSAPPPSPPPPPPPVPPRQLRCRWCFC